MLNKAVATDPSQFVQLNAASRDRENGAPEATAQKMLFGMDTEALGTLMLELGEPAWRGKQIAEAIYCQRVTELSAITTLSKNLRAKLVDSGWKIGRSRIAQVFQSVDGTERYLIQSENAGAAETVETVWMPEGDDGESGDGTDSAQPEAADISLSPGAPSYLGAPPALGAPSSRRISTARVGKHQPQTSSQTRALEENWQGAPSFRRFPAERVGEHEPQPAAALAAPNSSDGRWHRATICVSSQIGCAVNCQFCLTAKLGLQRNLTAGEIAGQVLAVLDRQSVEVGRDRVNLVFMGMGEPFLNYDNFMGAVRLLVHEVGLSPQRMTVSTSGIVPGIERFAQEPQEIRPKLAISLNAPNDLIREQIMPINRKWNIESVMDAVRQVKLRPRERITFEYVLLGGVTDQRIHAQEVARLVRRTGLPAKVNLIAWNPGPGIAYSMPAAGAVEVFRSTLAGEGVPTYLRRPRGRDIYAACGQLKRTVEG
jgi:23S rRNA (adenine2503-C2)-methyltransferase